MIYNFALCLEHNLKLQQSRILSQGWSGRHQAQSVRGRDEVNTKWFYFLCCIYRPLNHNRAKRCWDRKPPNQSETSPKRSKATLTVRLKVSEEYTACPLRVRDGKAKTNEKRKPKPIRYIKSNYSTLDKQVRDRERERGCTKRVVSVFMTIVSVLLDDFLEEDKFGNVLGSKF